jgi:hypothetical protein
MSSKLRRPGPALIVALIALIAALTGSAVALPGSDSVNAGDLKKNSVGKSEIKGSAVAGSEIKAGSVKEADLAAAEPFHRVGAAGEPVFANGGDGDCLWANPTGAVAVQSLGPAAYYRDPYGVVHLTGFVAATDGPGGDGACGGTDSVQDSIIFTLPEGYRPENAELHSANDLVALIVPDEGAVVSSTAVAPGSVLALGPAPQQGLDGFTFRVAGEGTAIIDTLAAQAPEFDSVRSIRRAVGG